MTTKYEAELLQRLAFAEKDRDYWRNEAVREAAAARAALAEALATIEALAGQQAMPDDSYLVTVQRIRTAYPNVDEDNDKL